MDPKDNGALETTPLTQTPAVDSGSKGPEFVEVSGFQLGIGFKRFHLRLTEIKKVVSGKTTKRGGVWQCDCGNLREFDFYRVLDGSTQACGDTACQYTRAYKDKLKKEREREKAKMVAPAPVAAPLAVEELTARQAEAEAPVLVPISTPPPPLAPIVPLVEATPAPKAFVEHPAVQHFTKQPELGLIAPLEPVAPMPKTVGQECQELAQQYASVSEYNIDLVLVALEWDTERAAWNALIYLKNERNVSTGVSGWGKTAGVAVQEVRKHVRNKALQQLRAARQRVADLAWAEQDE
jgi:hypothetical protein